MKKEKNAIKPVDVTGKVQYEQSFCHRYIEDAETNNPTMKGVNLPMPLLKVIDITQIFKELTYGNKLELAYFRLYYSNKHPYKKGRLVYDDIVCCTYLDGSLTAANMRLPFYFVKGMRKNTQGHRDDVVDCLLKTGGFDVIHTGNAEDIIEIMINYAPTKEAVMA
jgi:hypothetical protein